MARPRRRRARARASAHAAAMEPRRRLVVISGAPGTGKTTVGAALAEGLGLPILSLDAMKEALADVLGLGDEAWSDSVGDAAAEVVFRLSRSAPVIAEGWWRRERRERAIAEFAGAVEVFCHCEPALAEQRMRTRHQADRHPIHRDVINPALLDAAAQVAAEVTPLDLGGPLVRVDTTARGSFGDVVERVAAAMRRQGSDGGGLPLGDDVGDR